MKNDLDLFFTSLLEVIDHLIGPDGCPWDQKQTIFSLQPYFLEEVHELLDAIATEEKEKIIEEAGDVLIAVLFLAAIAKKEHLFTLREICKRAQDKLVSRHPHVFGSEKGANIEAVEEIWEKQKKKEQKRKSKLDGIPRTLPLLQRCDWVIRKIKKTPFPLKTKKKRSEIKSQKEFGELLFDLLMRAHQKQWNASSLLRKKLMDIEKEFRSWEKKAGDNPIT